MMKPKYQARKKSVAGMTNDFFRLISSRNSGERSTATQSISGWRWLPPAPASYACVIVALLLA